MPDEEGKQPLQQSALAAWAKAIKQASATGAFIKLDRARVCVTKKKWEALDIPDLASRVVQLTLRKDQRLGLLSKTLEDYQDILAGLSQICRKHNRTFFAQMLGAVGLKTSAQKELEKALAAVADTVLSLEGEVRKSYRERRVTRVAGAQFQKWMQLTDADRETLRQLAFSLCVRDWDRSTKSHHHLQQLQGANFGLVLDSLAVRISDLAQEDSYEGKLMLSFRMLLEWAAAAEAQFVFSGVHYERLKDDFVHSTHGLESLKEQVGFFEDVAAQMKAALEAGDLAAARQLPFPKAKLVQDREALENLLLELSQELRHEELALQEEQDQHDRLTAQWQHMQQVLAAAAERAAAHIETHAATRLGVWLLGGLKDHPMLYAVSRQADGTYTFSVINTGLSSGAQEVNKKPLRRLLRACWSGLKLRDVVDLHFLQRLLGFRQRVEILGKEAEEQRRVLDSLYHFVSDHFGRNIDVSRAKPADQAEGFSQASDSCHAVVHWMQTMLPEALFQKLVTHLRTLAAERIDSLASKERKSDLESAWLRFFLDK